MLPICLTEHYLKLTDEEFIYHLSGLLLRGSIQGPVFS